MLKNLKTFGRLKVKEALYPPILDRDPEFAAEFLTIEDSKFYLPAMQEVMQKVINNERDFSPLTHTISYSDFNYKWFCKFTNRLEELEGAESTTVFPELLDLPKGKRIEVYAPFHASTNSPVYDKFRVKTKDPIDLHRINYIRKDVELEDFRDGFPAWYLMTPSTVFEKYNAVTNTRVRIDFRNGEFYYFISGASDNWKQIHDIPLEMDHVVSALLFRN